MTTASQPSQVLTEFLFAAIDQRDALLRQLVTPCRNALLFAEQALDGAERRRVPAAAAADARARLTESAEEFARVLIAHGELIRALDELRAAVRVQP